METERKATVELRTTDSSRNVPHEEAKKEADKPLYLTRYE